MKIGQLLFLIIICAVIGTAGWMVMKKGQSSWEGQDSIVGQELYPDFPLNDIANLVIKSKEKSIKLSKKDDYWTVSSQYSYYADFVKIADFLRKINDLKLVQKIEIGSNDFGRLQLNSVDQESDTGIEIEFLSSSNASLGKILLGKEHMKKAEGSAAGPGGGWPDGRYIFQPKSKIVALVSETFSSISDDSDQWLDKEFFKVDKLKSVIVKKGETELWRVSREAENDSLKLDGEIAPDVEVDSSKISGIDGSLRYPNFNKVADPSIGDEVHGFSDGREFIAETFTGFTYTISVGNKDTEENYPIRIAVGYVEPSPTAPPADETEDAKATREADDAKKLAEAKEKFKNESKRYTQWVYIVSSSVVDDMILDRSDLLKKKDVPKVDPAQVPTMPVPVTVPNLPQVPEGSNSSSSEQ